MANSKYLRQAKRWLATNDRKWLKLRAVVLSENPLCEQCLAEGVMPPKPSSVCDHRDGHAETPHDYRRENLAALCFYHHSLKSIMEDGGFGSEKGKAKPRGCDANGVPIDPSHHWRKQD